MKALDASHDRLREGASDADRGSAEPLAEGGSAEPPPHPRQTHADALVEMSAATVSASEQCDPYQVTVHVDAEALTRGARGQARIADGPALAPETASHD